MSETQPEVQPGRTQGKWRELIARTGSEDAARRELARQLRLAADIVERPGYPDVFACEVTLRDDWEKETFIMSIGVTVSYPWPG